MTRNAISEAVTTAKLHFFFAGGRISEKSIPFDIGKAHAIAKEMSYRASYGMNNTMVVIA